MPYSFLVVLIALFIFSYWFGGRDFFAPATMQIITFCVSVLFGILYLADTDYKMHLDTIFLIEACMAISALIGIIIHFFFKNIKIKEISSKRNKATAISTNANYFILIFAVITLLWQLYEIFHFGGSSGSFNQIMHTFHSLTAYTTESENQIPILLKLFQHIVLIFLVLYGFNIIKFHECLTNKQKITNIIILVMLMVSTLLNGGRGGMIITILSYFVIYHMLRIQKYGKYRTYSIKFILRVILIGILVLYIFYFSASFVGRNINNNVLSNIFDYFGVYLGAHTVNLDLYLHSNPERSDIWGKYTFLSLIKNLREIGLYNISTYLGHFEFRSYDGKTLGNVYTFIRTYYSDFGLFGVLILHSLMVGVMSVMYEYIKKRKGNISIIVFSYIYYSVALSFFAERFFSTVFCLSMVEKLSILTIFYLILIKKSIKLTLCRKKC